MKHRIALDQFMAAICIPTRQRTVKRLKTPDMLWVGRRGFLSRQEKRGRLGEGERSLEEKKKKKRRRRKYLHLPFCQRSCWGFGCYWLHGGGGVLQQQYPSNPRTKPERNGQGDEDSPPGRKRPPKSQADDGGGVCIFWGCGPRRGVIKSGRCALGLWVFISFTFLIKRDKGKGSHQSYSDFPVKVLERPINQAAQHH